MTLGIKCAAPLYALRRNNLFIGPAAESPGCVAPPRRLAWISFMGAPSRQRESRAPAKRVLYRRLPTDRDSSS